MTITARIETNNGKIANQDNSGTVGVGLRKSEVAGMVKVCVGLQSLDVC